MSEQRTNLEIIAPSIEEAIEQGLSELGVTEEEVEVDVLDTGSRGLFGIGSRQARVRLTLRSVAGSANLNGTPPAPQQVIEKLGEGVASIPIPAAGQVGKAGEVVPVDRPEALALRVAEDVIRELLQKMKLQAQVAVHLAEPEDEHSKSVVWVDVQGSDLSILIGPRAETLNAFQYIAGLIVSKEVGKAVPLVVDVQGFRSRRIQQLKQLARRMADQAVKTGRRQVLEPMPANERRIIHIELRENPQVATESIGEEPRRKVTIIPK